MPSKQRGQVLCLWCGRPTEFRSWDNRYECRNEGCTAKHVPVTRGMLEELDLWVAPVQQGPWVKYIMRPNEPDPMEADTDPLWTGPFRVGAEA